MCGADEAANYIMLVCPITEVNWCVLRDALRSTETPSNLQHLYGLMKRNNILPQIYFVHLQL
jgi:hypothetical protein